jgi:hypothetical protein
VILASEKTIKEKDGGSDHYQDGYDENPIGEHAEGPITHK